MRKILLNLLARIRRVKSLLIKGVAFQGSTAAFFGLHFKKETHLGICKNSIDVFRQQSCGILNLPKKIQNAYDKLGNYCRNILVQ